MKDIDVLGVSLQAPSMSSLGEKVREAFLGKKKIRIAKINTEFLSRSLNDSEFRNTLNSFEIRFADGRGVLWAARYLTMTSKYHDSRYKILKIGEAIWQMVYSGAAIVFNPVFITFPIKENLPGVQALKMMLSTASDSNAGVYFFGATQADLEKAIEKIGVEFPKLRISGYSNGYDFQKDKKINPVSAINSTDAILLIVALGSPLQEIWIRDNVDKLHGIKVAVGEGGSLAFLSGTFASAPNIIRKLGLEWLWRLFMNTSLTHQTGNRLGRVWKAVPVFIYETVKWKIRNGVSSEYK
jgi:exopolysaccharide biosynthesis WecB/TagA/CpsF family protein